MTHLSLSALGVSVSDAEGRPRALLSDVNLDITDHRVAVLGSNGQGKTTLLRAVSGLTPPSEGTVSLDGAVIDEAGRHGIGVLFADTAAQLIMPTVVEDVQLSLRGRLRGRQRHEAALTHLHAHGIEHLAGRSVYELSGGERQLVALTSLLASAPRYLLADEPTAALDIVNRRRVVDALLNFPAPLLVATHDLDLAAQCERAIWVHAGRVVADGEPSLVAAAYVAAANGEVPWPA